MAVVSLHAAQERPARGGSDNPQVAGCRRSPPDRRNHASRQQLLHRVRAEFDELRGLKLTLAQARRLFGLREDVCQRVLNTFVREGLLHAGAGYLYARRDLSNLTAADPGRLRRPSVLAREGS
jgi:hypothetical protein